LALCPQSLYCTVLYFYRLPNLSSISIKLDGDAEGALGAVLLLVQQHATTVCNISFQLEASVADDYLTWVALGDMVNLTQLQFEFIREVCATV
jgi:hypothetical protein